MTKLSVEKPYTNKPSVGSSTQNKSRGGTISGTPNFSEDGLKHELPLCLNTKKCRKCNYIKDCEDTLEAEKAALIKEHREKKRVEKEKATAIKPLGKNTPTNICKSCSGRYRGKLAYQIDIVVNLDYGADHSALSMRHPHKCAEAGIYVNVFPLPNPIRTVLAIDDSNEEQRYFVAKKKIRISTMLMLPTGPLRLQKIEYLGFGDNMLEVLLSRPVLRV